MCCQDEANTIKLKLESRCLKPVWECGYLEMHQNDIFLFLKNYF
jgi:hypothetical protein